jgi:hypothetical protein
MKLLGAAGAIAEKRHYRAGVPVVSGASEPEPHVIAARVTVAAPLIQRRERYDPRTRTGTYCDISLLPRACRFAEYQLK